MVSEGGLQPASVGSNPVHLIVNKGRTSYVCCTHRLDRQRPAHGALQLWAQGPGIRIIASCTLKGPETLQPGLPSHNRLGEACWSWPCPSSTVSSDASSRPLVSTG